MRTASARNPWISRRRASGRAPVAAVWRIEVADSLFAHYLRDQAESSSVRCLSTYAAISNVTATPTIDTIHKTFTDGGGAFPAANDTSSRSTRNQKEYWPFLSFPL